MVFQGGKQALSVIAPPVTSILPRPFKWGAKFGLKVNLILSRHYSQAAAEKRV